MELRSHMRVSKKSKSGFTRHFLKFRHSLNNLVVPRSRRLFYSKRSESAGFTLLLAALVASITLAIGAAIYGIAIKELNLSSIGRDSQFAFYAADSAAECALYYDINKAIFSTTTPPTEVTCDGTVSAVTTVQNVSPSSDGEASFTTKGTYTFQTPSQYNMLTVVVSGAGGGGGGGSNGSSNGLAGTNGTASTFNGTVIGGAGGRGGGGNKNGSTGFSGSTGSGSGGDPIIPGGGAVGGTGGSGVTGGGTGGSGGSGGKTTRVYSSGELGTGVSITVVVGAGGTGGNPAGTAQSGNGGNDGTVIITWTGAAPTWSSTTFSFQSEPNGICAITYFTKSRVGNSIRNVIHTDGSNVICAATTTSPRALQRSVELTY